MHILRASFNGSPNVGLFGYATDKYLLFGENIPEKLSEEVKEALGNVELHHFKVAGTDLPGLFLTGNSKTLLIPGIAFQRELDQLDELGIKYSVLETEQTCLGNNIVCNDHGAVISTDFTEDERKRIEEFLGVPAMKLDIASYQTPGAFLVVNGDKGVIHRDATEDQIASAEKLLQITISAATVNLGTPYLGAGILNNDHGLIIGDASGGPEIVHIDEVLGYEVEE